MENPWKVLIVLYALSNIYHFCLQLVEFLLLVCRLLASLDIICETSKHCCLFRVLQHNYFYRRGQMSWKAKLESFLCRDNKRQTYIRSTWRGQLG